MPHNTFDIKTITLFSASVSSSATQTASIDCRGFGEASIRLSSNGTGTPLALKVEESDDDSTWTAIGLTGGTDFSLANLATTTNPLAVFDVNLVGKKRYLKLTVTPGSTQVLCATANLGRASTTPAANAAHTGSV